MHSVLSFVVLGGSGALAKKETYPSLFGLWKQGHLPAKTHIVSYARSKKGLDEFKAQVREGLPEWATDDDKDQFSAMLYYEIYEKIDKDAADLDKKLTELEDRAIASMPEGRDASSKDGSSKTVAAPKLACNRVLYLAVPPDNFIELAKGLRKAGPDGNGALSKRGWTRLLVEKPIGRDSESAQKVNDELGSLFEEEDIFRVDHFLGYQTVQQLPSLRADNPLLFGEQAFSARTVQAIEVTLHEEFGVSGRGEFFDVQGIIRDVVANHLLQVLVTLLMDLPQGSKGVQGPDADEEAWRDAKVKLLKQFVPIKADDAVVGQYTRATANLPSYVEEGGGIPTDSITPTFASVVLRLQGNERWKDVPFILRAGKGVHESKGEIRVLYKDAEKPLSRAQQPNQLRVDVNGDGVLQLTAHAVEPAHTSSGTRTHELTSGKPDASQRKDKAYMRVFVDCIRGAHANFYRRDELQACWKLFDDLLHGLEKNKQKPLPYKRGTRGPKEADELARRVGFVRPEEKEEQADKIKLERNQYDLIVVGGGSGGFGCARRAASHGASVLLIEQLHLGGTCVNVGCIPKKLFWNAASILETLEVAPSYGIEVAAAGSGGLLHGELKGALHGAHQKPRVDWENFKLARDEHISKLRDSYENNAHNDSVEVVRGHAKFVGESQVSVSDKDGKDITYSAKHIVIAVGSEPSMDTDGTGIKGAAEFAISSDDFFKLEHLPSRVAVIGGGYIAVELAQVMATFGAKVDHYYRQDRALKKFDSMLSETLRETHREAGIKQIPHTRIEEICGNGSKRQVKYRQSASAGGAMEPKESEAEYDVVLLAAGRKPRIEKLGLDKAGVKTEAHPKTGFHFIPVDAKQNTNVKGIYALGDVVSKVDLTPVAIAAGRNLAERLFNSRPSAKQSYDAVPSVIFTHPPIGTVGLTEKQAVQQEGAKQVAVYEASFTDLFYSLRNAPSVKERAEKAGDDDKAVHVPTQTKVKLVCVGPQERVAGVHVIGRGADEMLQGFAVAVKAGLTKDQFDACVAIHPTAAEEVVTLKKKRQGRAD